MNDDSRWTVGLSGQIECVGYVVETDDRSDTGQRIQTTGGDRVEGPVPVLRVRAAAEVYDGSPVAGSKRFEAILKEAVEEETVPDDETAFKQRHKTLRGKLNVPRERFRSLTSKSGYYIWAGR